MTLYRAYARSRFRMAIKSFQINLLIAPRRIEMLRENKSGWRTRVREKKFHWLDLIFLFGIVESLESGWVGVTERWSAAGGREARGVFRWDIRFKVILELLRTWHWNFDYDCRENVACLAFVLHCTFRWHHYKSRLRFPHDWKVSRSASQNAIKIFNDFLVSSWETFTTPWLTLKQFHSLCSSDNKRLIRDNNFIGITSRMYRFWLSLRRALLEVHNDKENSKCASRRLQVSSLNEKNNFRLRQT